MQYELQSSEQSSELLHQMGHIGGETQPVNEMQLYYNVNNNKL